MSTVMIRVTARPDAVAEIDAAATDMFAAIEQAQPQGVRYASTKLPDGVTYLVLLQVAGDGENPLAAVPEFVAFQQRLQGWLAGPPLVEPLSVVGSYRLF